MLDFSNLLLFMVMFFEEHPIKPPTSFVELIPIFSIVLVSIIKLASEVPY